MVLSPYLSQASYIDKLVGEFLPDGVPDKFTSAMPPAADDLPRLVIEAMEDESERDPAHIRRYQSGAIGFAALLCDTY